MNMNTNDTIKAIKQLIAIPSTADNPAALKQAVDFMADFVRMRVPDITIERFEHNGKPSFLAYRGAVRPQRFNVILNGHVDVVPGDATQFTPHVKGNNLYGRGTFDMKAAALVEALVFCHMAHVTPYALGLQVVSDEEVGGYDGTLYQIEQGVRADFVITGEHALAPNVIYTEQRGIAWAEVAFSGKTAHGGYPWNGDNALTRASAFAHAVLARYPVPKTEVWSTTANIASIHTSNVAHNRVPADALVKIDFRFTAEDEAFYSKQTLEALIHSLDAGAQVIDIPVFDPAMAVDEHSPYLHALVEALEQTSGRSVRFGRRYAGGDARHYAALGIDAVEFGLTGSHMHSNDEFVDLSAIPSYIATLQRFLSKPAPMPSSTLAKRNLSNARVDKTAPAAVQ